MIGSLHSTAPVVPIKLRGICDKQHLCELDFCLKESLFGHYPIAHQALLPEYLILNVLCAHHVKAIPGSNNSLTVSEQLSVHLLQRGRAIKTLCPRSLTLPSVSSIWPLQTPISAQRLSPAAAALMTYIIVFRAQTQQTWPSSTGYRLVNYCVIALTFLTW